jgi:hypothetical protein
MMKKFNFRQMIENGGRVLRQNSPDILMGLGISGMILTTILAVKATPEALRRIEKKKQDEHHKKLTAKQTVEAAWKCYIPATATGLVSTACLIGASTMKDRRNAALATAYSLAETSLREYRNKVVETVGEKKESAIRDAIDRDRVAQNPPRPNETEAPIVEGDTKRTLCYDSLFGRYFYSDIDTIKRAVNKLNRQMTTMTEPYISLNEFYMEIGLPPVDVGSELGWNVDKGMIELRYSSQLVNEKEPCLVITHLIPPIYDFDK